MMVLNKEVYMDEKLWYVSQDPLAMLQKLGIPQRHTLEAQKCTSRKLRLFCCACLWYTEKPDEVAIRVYEHNGIEGYSDAQWAHNWSEHGRGKPTFKEKCDILRCLNGNPWFPIKIIRRVLVASGSFPDYSISSTAEVGWEKYEDKTPLWLTHDVIKLAESCYHNIMDNGQMNPHRLGILTDCLLENGCHEPQGRTKGQVMQSRTTLIPCCNEYADKDACQCFETAEPDGVISHLREKIPHYRGCHVIDMLLGKK